VKSDLFAFVSLDVAMLTCRIRCRSSNFSSICPRSRLS